MVILQEDKFPLSDDDLDTVKRFNDLGCDEFSEMYKLFVVDQMRQSYWENYFSSPLPVFVEPDAYTITNISFTK